MKKMEAPFEVSIDDEKLDRLHIYTDGKNFAAKVLPKESWPESLKKEIDHVKYKDGPMTSIERFDKPIPVLEEPIDLYFFATPASEYIDLEDQIRVMDGKKVSMGDMPTLKVYKQPEIKAELERGFYYDLFAIGTYRGNRVLAGGGRISTDKEDFPKFVTLDELKFFGIEHLDLTQEQAKGIEAKISPMTAWGNYGRLIIAGFDFGEKKPGWNVGIMVNHASGIDSYHGYTKEEIREFIGV